VHCIPCEGGCALPGADKQKPYAVKCGQGQGKTIIDVIRDFLRKSPMSKLQILFQLKFPRCICFPIRSQSG
jgi:hypothetical protein